MSNKPWTPEERASVIQMRADGFCDKDIAKALNRSRSAISYQFFAARLGPEGVKAYNDKHNRTRKRRPRVLTSTMIDPEIRTIYRPTPEMLADRARREAMPHRDLTSMLCGGPPVGMSALEGRR